MILARRHWAVLLKTLLPTLGIAIGAFVLSQIAASAAERFPLLQLVLWFIVALVVVRFAWQVLEWRKETITVTDKRFMINSGIIETKSFIKPLDMVTGISFEHTVAGRVLHYGTLTLESAGPRHDIEKIEYVPEEVFNRLSSLALSP